MSTSTIPTLTPKQLHILLHSLGLDDYGRGTFYRNYYVAGPGHHSFDDCRELVRLGLMTERAPSELTGGDSSFHVTERGRQAVQEQSPPAPKLSRSQERYLRYLEIRDACNLSFGAWLKGGAEHNRAFYSKSAALPELNPSKVQANARCSQESAAQGSLHMAGGIA